MSSHPFLLFDFGGTLADIHPQHEWLYVRACSEFGIELDPGHAGITDTFGWEAFDTPDGPVHLEMSASEAAFSRHKTAVIVDRLQRMGVEASPGRLLAIASRIYELDTHPDMYRVYDDVLPVLDALKGTGHRMAIVSNHEWALEHLIAGLGLAHYFEHVVTSARVGYRKPHPRMFHHVLDLLSAEPRSALMVGDSVSSDIAGAQRMGMAAAYLDRTGTGRSVPGVPTIASLAELPELGCL